MLKLSSRAALAIAASLGAAGAASANHIDFIADGAFTVFTSSETADAFVAQAGNPDNILGGEREVRLSVTGGTGFALCGTIGVPQNAGPAATDGGEAGSIRFDTSTGALGTLSLLYNGVGGSGLGGLDFDTVYDFASVSFDAVQGEGDLTVTFTDTGGNSGAVTQAVNAAGDYTVAFTAAGYAGVDFTSINSVEVTVASTLAASDFSINTITREVVPEPATAALAGAGLLVMLRRRRG